MSHLRAVGAVALLAASVLACSEEPATSVPRHQIGAPVDLAFTFPDVTNETLIRRESQVVEDASGPAAVLSDPTSPDDDPPSPPLPSKLISTLTEVGHQDNYAYSRARQRYTGNHGEISTTATVSYEGTVIGTSMQFNEQTVPYLTDLFGQEKTLLVETYVFTDQRCGLRVEGRSEHVASWQWFLGPVSNWGRDARSTVGFPPYEQPPCEEVVLPYGPGGDGGVEGGGAEDNGVVTCWYLVTIDYETGELIDARFLYCDGVEEGG